MTPWATSAIAKVRWGAYSQTFDQAGRLEVTHRSGGGSTTYEYDELGRITEIEHTGTNLTGPITYGLGYDAAGQLISMTDHGITRNYTYDALGQLTNDSADAGSTQEYDANGNRITTGYVVTENNQYQTDAT